MNPAAQNLSCIAHTQLTWNISMSESLQSLERWCRSTYFEGWIVKYSYVSLHWLSMRSAELLNGTCTILRPARNSPNSRDHRQFNFVFIPSQKFSFSHHNNFSYDIKAYSPFRWSSTHFVRTSGAVLLIVEIHTCTFLPLLIPLDRNPFILGSYSMLIPHVRLGFCVWRHTRIWQSTLKYSERK